MPKMSAPKTQSGEDATPTTNPLWAKLALAGVGAGLVHSAVESSTVLSAPRVEFAFSFIVFAMVSMALLTLASSIFAVVGGTLFWALAKATKSPRIAAALLAATSVVPVWLLNGHIREKAAIAYWLGMGALTAVVAVVAGLAAGQTSEQQQRRWRWFGMFLWAGFGGLFAANVWVLPGLYEAQHATLTYAALVVTVWAGVLVLTPTRTRLVRPAVALAMAIVFYWVMAFVSFPPLMDQRAQALLHISSTESGHLVLALQRAMDFDGDGYASVLGGPDCDDGDSAIRPGAAEIPGDGIDQDCIGGDLLTADVEQLIASMGGHVAPTATPPSTPPSIVFLTADTLRWDAALTMETAERLGSRGVIFERAYATIPSTFLSFYSMLTGRFPSGTETEVEYGWDLPIPDRSESLIEILKRLGYRSEGVFVYELLKPNHGVTRGFDVGLTQPTEDGWLADDVTNQGLEALDRLQARDGPFLLWLHYYDPHADYFEHHVDPETGRETVSVSPPGRTNAEQRELYQGEVDYVDRHMQRILDRLVEDGVLDDVVVVFASDHGESLGERGLYNHGTRLNDEQTRTRLVIAAPGLDSGAAREVPVSLVGLAPTLTSMMGLEGPADTQGRSFARLLYPDPPLPERPVPVFIVDDDMEQFAVVEWPWKLIYHRRSHFFELFNLELDENEYLNVFDDLPPIAEPLERLLATWMYSVHNDL